MTSLEAALRQIHVDLTEPASPSHWSAASNLVDLRALLGVTAPAELSRAKHSLALIAARGYHRGRDLVSEMNSLVK